jgi:hypothetical protein
MFDVFRRNITVIREGPGQVVDYIQVKGVTSTFVIKASVQPTPAEIMEILPEGYRTKESYTLYTDTELKTAIKDTTGPDIVLLDGVIFIVFKVSKWQNTLLKHFEIVVIKRDSDAA